jgi:hypothetical protein
MAMNAGSIEAQGIAVISVALVWWFLTDRFRDIARAVRGE